MTGTNERDIVSASAPGPAAPDAPAGQNAISSVRGENGGPVTINQPDDEPLKAAEAPERSEPVAEKFEDALQYPSAAITFDATPDVASNARDLSPIDWQTVLEINSLLHGFHIREEHQDVVRARRNAFMLKSSSQSPGTTPYFQVEDGSSLQVQETKNYFQRSLAQNAFSQRCIESSLSAGDFGIMAGLSGKRERIKSSNKQVRSSDSSQEYYAIFNFPRARILLDEIELQLSDQCVRELRALESNPTYARVQSFFKLFGHVFVTSVLLGGQQKTSKFAAAMKVENQEDQQEALPSAFGAKVNAQYVSASTQISQERRIGEVRNDEQYTNLSYLGTSTNGGNALIGSEYVTRLGDLFIVTYISQHSKMGNDGGTVQELEGHRERNRRTDSRADREDRRLEPHPIIVSGHTHSRPMQHRPWTGRFSFLLDGKPLCWVTSGGDPYLYPSLDNYPKAIFTVVSAVDAQRKGARQAQEVPVADLSKALHSDWPLFLSSTLPEYEQDLPVMIGKFLRGVGQLVLASRLPHGSCRNSMRHVVSAMSDWTPQREQVIRSGDQVHLYCHSLGLGPYANINRPPQIATPVMRIGRDSQIILPIPAVTERDENHRNITAYEKGTLSAIEQEAFERLGMFTLEDIISSGHDLVAQGVVSPEAMRHDSSGLKRAVLNYKTVLQEPWVSAGVDLSDFPNRALGKAIQRSGDAYRKYLASSGPEYAAMAQDEASRTPVIAALTVVFE